MLSRDKGESAEKIIRKIARENKKELKEDVLGKLKRGVSKMSDCIKFQVSTTIFRSRIFSIYKFTVVKDRGITHKKLSKAYKRGSPLERKVYRL